MEVAFSLAEIAAIVKPGQIRGATGGSVRGIASLSSAEPGDLAFLGNAKYRKEVATTRASVVLLPRDYAGEPGPDQAFLIVDNPSVALGRVCARIEQALWPKPAPGIHPSAVVAPGALIGAGVTIGPLCVVEDGAVVGARCHLQAQVFVGREARIGDDCWLMPGSVVACYCVLGSRVMLQPGAIVGSDGFGYEFVDGRHEKVPQIGAVLIGEDVEIGAGSTVDRARFGNTVVGEGTKIDNLVQVGHNVVIGKHCVICAQAGISGSTTLEDFVILGGQVGLAGHIRIGRGAKVGAQSGVAGDLSPGAYHRGSPSRPFMTEQRIEVLSGRLPDLFKRFDALEKSVGEAKSSQGLPRGA